MIAKLRAAGATDVIQHGANWAEADRYLREDVLRPLNEDSKSDTEGVYVAPFDDERVRRGNATMIPEIERQLKELDNGAGFEGGRPDAVICSVGGGGLFSGLEMGILERGWEGSVPLLAMETKGADSLAQALAAGKPVTLPGITSIATSLGATRVADATFELARRPNVRSVVLEDGEAAMGCWRFADDERMLVEAACGVSVAMCYDGRLKEVLPELRPDSRVVVVVCGGSNVTVGMLEEYRERFKEWEGVATGDKTVPSTLSAPK